ncbi:MAG: hypothetical protein ACLPYS_20275 [Vulcanimicrobiaceae bacterium]
MAALSGGPKYREHIHDFKAAVAGYAGAGVIAGLVIHCVVFAQIGDPTLTHVAKALGIAH